MAKIHIYIDANMIYGFFKKMLVCTRRNQDFEIPRVIEFLRNNLDRLEIYISPLTKAEIIRRLRTEWNCSKGEADRIWTAFESELMVNYIENATISNDIVELANLTRFKKRINNLIHVVIAKEYNLIFLTGDKEILGKAKEFYPDIISYHDLRAMLQ